MTKVVGKAANDGLRNGDGCLRPKQMVQNEPSQHADKVSAQRRNRASAETTSGHLRALSQVRKTLWPWAMRPAAEDPNVTGVSGTPDRYRIGLALAL
jgi:hypothetical protein